MKLFDTISRLMVVALLASAPVDVQAESWPESPPAEWTSLMERARAEGGIVVVGNAEIEDGLLDAFTSDTGIPATAVTGNRNEVQARVTRELETGQATFDVYLGGRTSYEYSDKGLLAPIAPMLMLPEVTDGSQWLDGELKWVDRAKTYLPLPSAYVSGFVLVNSDLVDASTIKSWDDLLAPELAGKIAIHDVAIRGAGISLATYLADVKGAGYLQALFGSQIKGVTKDYRELTDWIARGTYAIALGTRSVDIEHYQAQGVKSLRVVQMDDAPGYVSGGAAVMAIPADAPHPAAAQVFANWFLSQRGQEAFAKVSAAPTYRLDVENQGWPTYIEMLPGVTYVNTYDQEWTETYEPALVDIVKQAAGE